MLQSTNSQNLFIVIVVILFILLFVWTFMTVFSVTAKTDKASDMINAMSTVVMVNLVMVLLFTGISIWYVNTYPAVRNPYMMFMLHFNILLSIVSLSIATLYTVSK